MTVEEIDADRLNRSLSEKFRYGDKWVAYEDYKTPVCSELGTTFKNITDANNYCESQSDPFNFEDFYHFRFKQIINVIKSLAGGDSYGKKAEITHHKMKKQLQEHSVIATANNYKKSLVETLSDGLYHS